MASSVGNLRVSRCLEGRANGAAVGQVWRVTVESGWGKDSGLMGWNRTAIN